MQSNLKKIILILAIAFRLFMYIIDTLVGNSYLITISYLMIMLFLFILIIFNKKYSYKKFIFIVFLGIFSSLIFLIYKEDNLFFYFLIAILYEDEDTLKMVKIIFYTSLIMYIIVLILGITDIISSTIAYRNIDGNLDVRRSLGFFNANAVFIYYLPIVLSGYYLFSNVKIFNILVLITATILYFFARSRAGYIVVCLFILLSLFKNNKIIPKLSKNMFGIMTIISILIAILYGQNSTNTINELLSGRPYFSYYYLENNLVFTFFGNNMINSMILDNFYLRLLVNYGIIGYLVYFYIYRKGSSLLQMDYKLMLCSVIFLIYAFCESSNPSNFVLIIYMQAILKNIGVNRCANN